MFKSGSNLLIKYFSRDIRIQGSLLVTYSKGTISISLTLWPFEEKCEPTAFFEFGFTEALCSLNLSKTRLLVWPIYCGLFLQFLSCFLQVIQRNKRRNTLFLLHRGVMASSGYINLLQTTVMKRMRRGDRKRTKTHRVDEKGDCQDPEKRWEIRKEGRERRSEG